MENATVNSNLLKDTNPKCITENFTLDPPFIADEVSNGIAQLKNKNASGNYSISNEMFKLDPQQFYLFLSHFLTLY